MKTYYLKTQDEQSLWAALETAGLAFKEYDPDDPNNQRPQELDPEAEWEPTGEYEWRFKGIGALDIIGTIYEPTGNTLTDEDGLEYPEIQPIEGFHANLMAERGITGLPEITSPSTPKRKFAGA